MLSTGLSHKEKTVVSKEMLAVNVHSGGLEVFSTPSMIALMEKTAYTLLQEQLSAEKTSVGIALNIKHLAACREGQDVCALAEITDILKDGRIVKFKVSAFDDFGLIGEGEHERAVVNTQKFLEKLDEKLKK